MKNKQILNKIMNEIDIVVENIKSIKIQWATNVARAAFTVLRQWILSADFVSKEDFLLFLEKAIEHLVNARKTEPMLQNGMKQALRTYEKLKNKNLEDIIVQIDDVLQDLLDNIYIWDKLRADVGYKLIRPGYRVMTHCHSWSVVKVISKAWESGLKFEMINTETRPLFQWRLTAKDMLEIGVPTTLITDDMWPYYLSGMDFDTPQIDILIIGCDAIKSDGSVINKVGSFGLALSAYHSGVPVYVVGGLTKYDSENKIKIEMRDGREVWPHAPQDLNILNFAFDIVPAKFITGIVSRDGILKPCDVKETVEKKYPWMMVASSSLL